MFNIAPSLMCADLLQIGHEVRELERAGADLFHLDVMDGHFVPNLGLSFDLIRQICSFTQVPLDVHLMVATPEHYVPMIAALPISHVSFHIEATHNPIRVARSFRAAGAKAGIALNPATPAVLLQHLVEEIDYVVAMTVEPGFAGQKFIPSVYEKLHLIHDLLQKKSIEIPIEVDGNLDVETSSRCIEYGATILVGGTSSVFRRESGLYSDYCSFRAQVERRSQASGRSVSA